MIALFYTADAQLSSAKTYLHRLFLDPIKPKVEEDKEMVEQIGEGIGYAAGGIVAAVLGTFPLCAPSPLLYFHSSSCRKKFPLPRYIQFF